MLYRDRGSVYGELVVKRSLTVAGLFAGVGGIELGFQRAGFAPVFANEIDKYATQTYRANHQHTLAEGDIGELSSDELPKGLTVLAGGFPCQPFSVAGYRKGFEDDRGNVFRDIVRLVQDRQPEIVFLENVKNLSGHDNGNTFRVIHESLEASGYSVAAKVLNASEYGNIPQNRERIYIIGFKSSDANARFQWPERIPLTTKLSDLIDFRKKVDPKYYYTNERPFWNALEAEITKTNTIYQWRRQYVRQNKSGVSPTLTANMGMGGHNVPLIKTRYGIRKLTPRECFNLMGFDSDFVLPQTLAQSQLYKQAGNSVVVPVIQRIATQVLEAISNPKAPR
jgi:DNA (cytosine-5)-methyltransferase 1